MTVRHFQPRRPTGTPTETAPVTAAAVTGTFRAASGWTGTFTGSFLLDRLLTKDGQTIAVGMVIGELVTDDGRSLGVGSRRQTAAAEVTSAADAFRVQVGPVELTLLGCLVTVDAVAVTVPRDLPTGPGVPQLPVTGTELPRYGVPAAGDPTA